jgi:hypothetical protein
MIYQERAPQPQRPSIYVDNQYAGLGAYTTTRKSPWQQGGKTPGESDQAYVNRLKGHVQHLAETLPAAELEVVAAEYNAAVQRLEGGQTHTQLREQLDSRTSGTGVGIMGAASLTERAAALGNRGFGGEQQLQPLGHLAADTTVGVQPRATAADVNGILA